MLNFFSETHIIRFHAYSQEFPCYRHLTFIIAQGSMVPQYLMFNICVT